ncbi:MAG: NADH-quinone oxidoreductase subunit D [Ignavibacteriaceae bacterium]|nr:NADH-quinone oxidoreductase subunit D [Ignavibacterium sp.]MCC6254896.1 NADH-quinone oxidoreductase subunit D [Ignavibacteriaceae bacterium]HRN27408.1 NADH-quinone oxidoreductase subunit D [Ignavibacteriaceae bacterium]HRP93850.1 NADH-quinone oxidoreductase subunit D [Ignavibacteriaceae bacterium]HRQ55081.1 NADH-quinone oxidoreductase subunit D [Ignavibacteriaceae bacterium]
MSQDSILNTKSSIVRTEEMVLNMGPQHPSTHGVLRLELALEGEIITNVISHIGYLHRCFEKHCEAMTYPQIVPYTDRMDYLAPMGNEFGYAIAMEKLLGIELPERVEYIRVIMAELQRISSHLVALGTYGADIGAFTPFLYCFRDREKILSLFEITCGARLLYNYIWIGGLSHDLHPDFVRKTREFIKEFRPNLKEINELLSYNRIFIDRTANVGILPIDTAINYGVSGPNLRGSGFKWDVRREDPYSIYHKFDYDIPVGEGTYGTTGDSWDRYFVRVLEMEESCKIIEQALDQLPEGDVQSAIPKRIKPPVGQIYARVENPRGELGYFIISDGSTTPYRVKVRAPSFVSMQILNELCKGYMVADVVTILGSIDIVLGEIDR